MCNGEACLLCGAGLRHRFGEPPCAHDVIERHQEDEELRMSTPTLEERQAEALAWWKNESAKRGQILRVYLEEGISWYALQPLVESMRHLRKAAWRVFLLMPGGPFCIPVDDKIDKVDTG